MAWPRHPCGTDPVAGLHRKLERLCPGFQGAQNQRVRPTACPAAGRAQFIAAHARCPCLHATGGTFLMLLAPCSPATFCGQQACGSFVPAPRGCTACRCNGHHQHAVHAFGDCSEYIEPEDEFDANPRPEEEAARAGEHRRHARLHIAACMPAVCQLLLGRCCCIVAGAGASVLLHLRAIVRQVALKGNRMQLEPGHTPSPKHLSAFSLMDALWTSLLPVGMPVSP